MKLFSFLFLFLAPALGDSITINDAQGLIKLSNDVSAGTTYSGTTVLLGSDIDFNGIALNSIGKDLSWPFLGTLDGQGHTISNLEMISSVRSAGLLGYSEGLTIRNLVIDGSCSVTSIYAEPKYYPIIGSVIGYCTSKKGSCIIDSVVNVASVIFKGDATGYLYIGGIVGYFNSEGYSNILKNCMNYGSVTHSGVNTYCAFLGGIAGLSQGEEPVIISIQNCANYGIITQTGSPRILEIGGIVGISSCTIFENCVNSGAIRNKTSGDNGGITGQTYDDSKISHCYWTSDTGYNVAYGYCSSIVNVTESSLATLDQTTLTNLNDYVKKDNTWSNWVMLHLNGGRIGNARQGTIIAIQKYIPDPVIDGNTFLFWCKDSELEDEFDPRTEDISKITDLYAAWKVNTVTFDLGNGTTIDSPFSYGTEIAYPKDVEIEGYTLNWWDNNITNMPAHNLTVTGHWTINHYKLTFDFGNGTEPDVRILDYNSTVVYPAISERTGYTYNGWDNSNIKNVPARDLNITAQWIINQYTVKFIFDNGTESDVKTLDYDTLVEYPDDPEKEGHTFTDWDIDNLTNVPAHDLTITALWTINNYTLTFDFGNGTELVEKVLNFDSPITYPDNATREGYTFTGWSSDTDRMPARNFTITAQWTINQYTLTFVFDNGTEPEVRILDYNSSVGYPAISERTGYTFNGWDNNITNMSARDITITAKWTPENYTVTFIFDTNGGDGLAVRTKQVTFNATYGPLPTPSKPGFTFAGWFTDGGVEVTNSTVVTIPTNHILRAQWEGVPTTQVEIVLGTKDLSREEVIEIIRRYTNAEFKIKEIEADSGSGETRLIVEFTSARESDEFVRSVKESDMVGENKVIKRVEFNPVEYINGSFSPMHQSFFLPYVFMM